MRARIGIMAWLGLSVLLAGCGSGRSDEAQVLLVFGEQGASDGRFGTPRAMAAGPERLYIVDKSPRIQLFDPADGSHLATWPIERTAKGYPTGLAVAPEGGLAVAETHNFRVRIRDRDGTVLRDIGRQGGGPGEFTYVTDVAFDSTGCMYVSEHGLVNRVQKFDPAGRFILAWGENGDEPGQFNRPQALAVDARDHVYVADAANHRVQEFTAEGEHLGSFGSAGREPGRMLYPYDLDIGPDETIVVCEYGTNRVQIFDRDGRSLACIGRPGRNPGELASPWAAVWIEGRGLFVADTGNHRIQLFSLPAMKSEGS